MGATDAVWALSLVNEMARLGVIDNTVSERARFLDAALYALRPTGDAQPPSGDS
jgi:hypothetical protein